MSKDRRTYHEGSQSDISRGGSGIPLSARHQSPAEGDKPPIVDKPIIQYGVEEALHFGHPVNIIIVTM